MNNLILKSLFFLLCSISFVWGQDNTRNLSGKVIDENSQPVMGARIIANGGEAGAETNENGQFSLSLAPGKAVILITTALDYKTDTLQLTANAPTENIVINLRYNAVTLGTVTITEQFRQREEQTTVSMSSVSTQRIDKMANVTIINAMQMVPGVTIYDDQPSIRGSSGYTYGAGSRVLTLLNGLPMLSADRGSVNWDMLPTDNLRQIEVMKGASSVLYGAGAMGGVINVITADPVDTPRTVIRFRAGFYDRPANKDADWDKSSPKGFSYSNHIFHSRKIDNLDLSLQADAINQNGYREGETSRRIRILLMPKYHFQGKLKGLTAGINTQISIDSTATIIAWENYPKGALQPGPGFLSRQLLTYFSADPYISYVTDKAQHLYQGRIFHQNYAVSTGQSGTATLLFNEYQYKRGFLANNLQLVAGVNYTRNLVTSDSAFGTAVGNQFSIFTQLKYRFSARLNAVIGARFQYETVRGDTASKNTEKGKHPLATYTPMKDPIFRAGINFRPTVSTYLRASFGQALRSPSVAERFTATLAGPIAVAPNPAIRIERGWTAEIGGRQLYKLGKVKGFVDASVFTMQFTDMVEFWVDLPTFSRNLINQTPGFPFTAQNISRASVNGVEINLNYDHPINKHWSVFLTGGITYIEPRDLGGDAKREGDGDVIAFGNELIVAGLTQKPLQDRPTTLKYRNKLLIRTNLDITFSRFTLTTNYSFTSHMVNVDKVFLLAISGVDDFRKKHDNGWHIVDFILAYRMPGIGSMISAHVFNAFNAEYMTIPGYMGEQRNFVIQWRSEF